MKATFIAPEGNQLGNLLWRKEQFKGSNNEIRASLNKLKNIGYWASAFPEGDGVTFKVESEEDVRTSDEMLSDFKDCFDWIEISLGKSKDSNTELAELEPDRDLKCIIIVPLDKIFIQKTLQIGPYSFFCRKEFDLEPFERLTNHESEYLQFETTLKYKDILRLNRTLNHNDYVINKCLSLAEYALDLVRFAHSSFVRREFTPNPAGQKIDGFFEVDIIPIEKTHIKPLKLAGISRPISVSNNWLGPQVDGFYAEGINYLTAIYNEDFSNEMTSSVKSVLRLCRQSFYSLGSESQFLNLVFALDGLTEPKYNGWMQRTYIAALLSGGSSVKFEKVLRRYNELYVEVRNKLVHKGMDFYQLTETPEQACDEMYEYIKDIIKLIENEGFTSVSDMKAYATQLLRNQGFKDKYTAVINSIALPEGQRHKMPSW